MFIKRIRFLSRNVTKISLEGSSYFIRFLYSKVTPGKGSDVTRDRKIKKKEKKRKSLLYFTDHLSTFPMPLGYLYS